MRWKWRKKQGVTLHLLTQAAIIQVHFAFHRAVSCRKCFSRGGKIIWVACYMKRSFKILTGFIVTMSFLESPSYLKMKKKGRKNDRKSRAFNGLAMSRLPSRPQEAYGALHLRIVEDRFD